MSQKVLEGLELIKDLCISDILETSIQDWLETSDSEDSTPVDAHRVIHW
jgi:hypothetical protein